jgi:hypothetical protein
MALPLDPYFELTGQSVVAAALAQSVTAIPNKKLLEENDIPRMNAV